MNGSTDGAVACDDKPTMPWASFGRYKMEIYVSPGVHLRLKVRMLKAEVMETLLYGCVTWSPSKVNYNRLRKCPPPEAPPMPRLAETKARRPHPILCQHVSQDGMQTKDIVRGLRGTHGRRVPAEEGDVWGDVRG